GFLRPAFKKIFAALQRGKCLEEFEFLDGYYVLSLDGTGEFSSGKVCCQQCCKKEHKDGSVTYYHQMLGACIVHPDKSNVIPLCPEIIQKEDGVEKNDCERNAAKRFIENFRREHPHLKVIIVGDGITSNAPYIRLLEENGMKYLLGAKPGDHQFLFDAIESSEETEYYEFTDEKGFFHQFRFLNQVALNKSNSDVLINFLEYMQTDPKGKETRFSWVTNICITRDNVFALMRGGRARWKIENETFNTLKNLGYNFEHNYGHGKKYLSTILCLLMMLAFFIDQVQEIACSLFQTIRKLAGTYRWIWETIRVLFQFLSFGSWQELHQRIATRLSLKLKNTS
ncbi:MAG: transposase, partial [Rhabdochlamydiaceae bacterium]